MGFFLSNFMDFSLFYDTSGICIDTRSILNDSLFVCLKGANFDANDFAIEALEKGAKYVVVNRKELVNENIFYVEDTLIFLQNLANFHRNKFDIPVIGITGSNGKTTSKELITTVLSKKYNVLSTIGNLNNHIGVPLTLLRLTDEHEIAVIEMGANKLKDIEELTSIAEPTHGIITNIGKAHLEGFVDLQGVITTKCEMFDAVSYKNGVLFYNEDDTILTSNLPLNCKKVSYSSINSNADVFGELINLNPFVRLKWKTADYISPELDTLLLGKYNFYNFLAAISIGVEFNVNFELINEAISTYYPQNNRSQFHKTEKNQLILDAYNANPSSMSLAIDSFSEMQHENKVALLGDMFELGNDSPVEHLKMIEKIVECKISTYFIGNHFFAYKDHFSRIDFIQFFQTKEDFINYVEENPIQDSLILLKGSRGIGLEKIQGFL
jgi:UDP-N-acetylmuramoyl-tripeptide--D-alanyl-D-alanine ligase